MTHRWASLAASAMFVIVSQSALADGPAYAKAKHKQHSQSHCGGAFAGTYIGAAAGMTWSMTDHNVIPSQTHDESSSRDFVGSGYVGHNWQCDRWVFGVEGDISFGNIQTTATYSDAVVSSNIDWYGTLRGRVGIAHENVMVYFTGGLAYANVDHSISAPQYNLGLSQSTDKWGYVLGGGMELSRGHWSIRAETMYVDLGSTDRNYVITNGCGTTCYAATKWDDQFWIARVGVSFKLGREEHYEPMK